MKFCNQCKFHEQKTLQGPNGMLSVGLVCVHEECRDVLEGYPIPCNAARQIADYCGFKARHFVQKDKEEEKVVSLIKT